jgi:ribokinase
VGSNTIDAFIYTDRSESINIKTISSETEFISFPLGSKIVLDDCDFYSGGGGTNSAVCLSRLGFRTAYIGKVGSDLNGKNILEELKTERVDFLGIESRDPKEKTGFSIVLDSIERKRTILTYRGANDNLRIEEIDKNKIISGWLYVSSMVGQSFTALEKIVEYAADSKINIIFNPNNYLCEKGKDFLGKILSNTDILILNKEEAGLLTGQEGTEAILKELKSSGPKIVIMTDGSKPVYLIDKDDALYTLFPLDIKIKEVTGAGDSFASTFLAGMIKTHDIIFSLKMAIINSHSVLQYKGAKNKLLSYEEILKKINDTEIIIKKGILKE